MDASRGSRRPVAVAALALAAVVIAFAGAQALDRRGYEVVQEESVAIALDDSEGHANHGASVVTTQRAVRALEAGLVDGDRLPADRPPLLAVRLLQRGGGSWCTSAAVEVATAADGTISVEVSRPWWRRLPTRECMEDVPAPSGAVVALDDHDLAAAPAVEVTGPIVFRGAIRCTPEDPPRASDWECLDEVP